MLFGVGILSAQHHTDTFPLAEPVLLFRTGVRTLPSGIERLSSIERGDTLFVWTRFWEAPPEGIQWKWGRDTFRGIIQVPPLPPDSVMPLADFSVPITPSESTGAEAFPLGLLWLLLGGGLVILGVYPLFRPHLLRGAKKLYLHLRWQVWLWRWRRPMPQRFPDFITAVKTLLTPYTESNPGSWTLAEVRTLTPHSPLSQVLQALWEADYQMHFMNKPLNDAEKTTLWRSAWQALRQVGSEAKVLSVKPLFPSHHMPSAHERAVSSLLPDVGPSDD
ncbi:MAG: hypothetical protein NZZ60_05855 [Bacteroidia bacterium]|nr:hypothetical protein [Bacteroidia bacterium]MDW8416511.1 hypothetical protein [Bacteroidia bacterium]